MTLSKRTGLILSLLIATTCCTLGCGDKPERLDLSAEPWREDLKYLAHTLLARHANAYHFILKERFKAAVADLDRQIEHLNRDAMWTGIGKIVALVGDAHTYLQAPRDNASFPIDFAKFGNTYRVEAASQELSRLLGARVIKVGNTPVEHAGELLFQRFSEERKTWSTLLYRLRGIRCLPTGCHKCANTSKAFPRTSPKRLCREPWSEGRLPQHRKAT